MEAQPLHSTALRLEFRQHLSVVTILISDLAMDLIVDLARATDLEMGYGEGRSDKEVRPPDPRQ